MEDNNVSSDNKTCGDCGHEESEHGTQVEPSEPSLERLFIKPCYRCPCKKFEEEEIMISKKKGIGILNAEIHQLTKENKRLKREMKELEGINKEMLSNAEEQLENMKKPQNHSPHVVEKETSRISSSQPSGHEGTFNHSPSIKRVATAKNSKVEDTFNLSSKRKELFDYIDIFIVEETMDSLGRKLDIITMPKKYWIKLKKGIEDQDKTFIKKDTKNFTYYLRGIINLSEYWERRKELAGEELLK